MRTSKERLTPNFPPIAYLNNQDTHTYPLKADINFMITDKASAVRHLSWVVDQGEGAAPFDPLTAEGIPGHYYRFESILKSRFLVKNENAELGTRSRAAMSRSIQQACMSSMPTPRSKTMRPFRGSSGR